MSFDAAALRRQFPILRQAQPGGRALHYLDNAATTQLPDAVLDAVQRHETTARANVRRGLYPLAEAADDAFEGARATVARHLGAAGPEEIVFTSGATAAINLLAHGLAVAPGDEIVLSQAEHHSNLVPWQMLAQRTGVRLRFLPVTPEGRLAADDLAGVIGERCRLIAVTHASNVTGAVSDVAAIVAAARAAGAPVMLDGAQAVQHGLPDVAALGVDFYVFSGHKVFAPNGIGVLWGRFDRLDRLRPFHGGGGMIRRVEEGGFTAGDAPWRFEAGTPPIAQAVGLAAALDWLAGLDLAAVRRHEAALTRRLLAGLAGMPGLRLVGPADDHYRLPVVSFAAEGVHPHDLCHLLGEQAICLRGGHHCAQPLLTALGHDAVSRASLSMMNDDADVDALLAALPKILRALR